MLCPSVFVGSSASAVPRWLSPPGLIGADVCRAEQILIRGELDVLLAVIARTAPPSPFPAALKLSATPRIPTAEWWGRGARTLGHQFAIDVVNLNDWLVVERSGISTFTITSIPVVTLSDVGFSSRSKQHCEARYASTSIVGCVPS